MNSWRRGSKGGGGGVVAAGIVCLPALAAPQSTKVTRTSVPKVGTLPYTMTLVAVSRGVINIQAGGSYQHCTVKGEKARLATAAQCSAPRVDLCGRCRAWCWCCHAGAGAFILVGCVVLRVTRSSGCDAP